MSPQGTHSRAADVLLERHALHKERRTQHK